jgi:hypothetical protein
MEPSQVDDAEAVRIFVQFQNAHDAETALQALNGRMFGGRRILCDLFEDLRYDRRDFAPTAEELEP